MSRSQSRPSTPGGSHVCLTPAFRPRTTSRFRQLAIRSGLIHPRSHDIVHTLSPTPSVDLDVPADPASFPSSAVTHETELHLRGGASTKRLASNERVPKAVWYLAGGVGKPPTGRELREWKRNDQDHVMGRTGGKPKEEKFWSKLKRTLFADYVKKDGGSASEMTNGQTATTEGGGTQA
ncbi:hypothetical protein MMC07_000522 [Pseudocyphellaria aurata]|nr:hypothetical protein [Pseudocyphellaria aurata]